MQGFIAGLLAVPGWDCSVLLRPPGGATSPGLSAGLQPPALKRACVEGRGSGGSAVLTTRSCEHRVGAARSTLAACQPAGPPAHGGAGAAELGRGPAQDPGSLPRGPEPGLRLRFRGVPPGGPQCTPGGESQDLRLSNQPQAWHLLALAGSRVPSVPADPRHAKHQLVRCSSYQNDLGVS